MRPQIYVALDFPELNSARNWLKKVPGVDGVKVGLELFYGAEPTSLNQFLNQLQEEGTGIFLDLKLHDIPNTVAKAVSSLKRLGTFSLLTLHTLGGPEMMAAAKTARDDTFGADGPALLGVTVLTSHSDEQIKSRWAGNEGRSHWVNRLATQAAEAGLEGVVCSVLEAEQITQVWEKVAPGKKPLVVTPGIRFEGTDAQDQKAVATPAEAKRRGATHLVVGRALTQAADPAAAYAMLLDEVS
jgi:orotidine-5'-phosphate decarboxylase